jgi:hypothetical protein
LAASSPAAISPPRSMHSSTVTSADAQDSGLHGVRVPHRVRSNHERRDWTLRRDRLEGDPIALLWLNRYSYTPTVPSPPARTPRDTRQANQYSPWRRRSCGHAYARDVSSPGDSPEPQRSCSTVCVIQKLQIDHISGAATPSVAAYSSSLRCSGMQLQRHPSRSIGPDRRNHLSGHHRGNLPRPSSSLGWGTARRDRIWLYR